jgi:hypothetical protein
MSQLFSLGCYAHHATFQVIRSGAGSQSSNLCALCGLAMASGDRAGILWLLRCIGSWICSQFGCHIVRWYVFAKPRRVTQLVRLRFGKFVWLAFALFVVQVFDTKFLRLWTTSSLTSRRSQPPLALAVPLSRFTSRVGGGSAFFVRRQASAPNFIMSRRSKKPLTICDYCKCGVRDIDSHLERCPKLKELEIAQERLRAKLKERAEMEHLKRLKRLAGYNKPPTPSRSSSKSVTHSAWRVIISGGAVETNPRKF